MCGICGVVQVGGVPREVVEAWRLDAMTDAMRHRGPDDRGVVSGPGFAFGARRLSIVDVEGGHQPFWDERGLVVGMQNGELYEHARIRDELEGQGHRFRSRCDTEILPHLYERERARLPELLRGKFAIAVWDSERHEGLIARDRLGIKPLYWAQRDDLLVFASELKSLLASGLFEPRLDHDAIDAYLSFGFVPAPSTPLLGIHKLLPGHRLLIGPHGVREEAYWHYPRPNPDQPARPEHEYAEELLNQLREAVRLRLMSDVPLGAMLSGGLDSSLIVALMASETSEPVKTFSVGFREDQDSNELADARTIANQFGTDHHELELSFTDDTADLTELVWHLDEPLADLSALGFLALCHLARQHVTVALSGQGADELLGGYRKHRVAAAMRPFARMPRGALRLPAAAASRAGGTPRRISRTLTARDAATRVLAMSGADPSGLRALRPSWSPDSSLAVLRRIADDATTDPLLSTLYVDGQFALPDKLLHYFDRTSMAHSLEVRVPFLDHHLVEYAATIPPNLKIKGLTTKHILKKAARTLLPDHIIDKRKIGFFRNAERAWLESQVNHAVRDHLLRPDAAIYDIVEARAVERLAARPRDNPQTLLTLLMLELWLQRFVVKGVSA